MKRLAMTLALLLAACGEPPQPFRHEGPNLALVPSVARGVVVRPLDGSPRAAALAQTLVRQLVEAEIPAALTKTVPGALVIVGDEEVGPSASVLRWRLVRPDGEAVAGLDQTIPQAVWERATPKTMDRIAAEIVKKLSGPLHGEIPVAAEVANRAPRVKILPLADLPGDGEISLAAAMRRMLERSGLRIAEDGGAYDVELRGRVSVVPAGADTESLAVAWTVVAPGGEQLGTITQEGPVPKGRLAGSWGTLAAEVAAGGAQGVIEMLRKLEGG